MKKTMGNWRLGMWKAITSLAMVITVVSVNSACMFEYYQPKMPKGSEKLRRD
ncbi:cyclic lactone autoinducer peptide [Anaerotignum sp.]|uniref:cyclic lactone autoinducer peptide n=1 Tax=Anaerotignum sp. TaxID=2039241 RepID=UPI002714F626|nr:cyclic lactone autoinducer peptide [Anaerotignum sp.]